MDERPGRQCGDAAHPSGARGRASHVAPRQPRQERLQIGKHRCHVDGIDDEAAAIVEGNRASCRHVFVRLEPPGGLEALHAAQHHRPGDREDLRLACARVALCHQCPQAQDRLRMEAKDRAASGQRGAVCADELAGARAGRKAQGDPVARR